MTFLGKPRVWEVEFFLLSPHEIEHGLSVMEVTRSELYETKSTTTIVSKGKIEKENGLLDLRMGSVERKRRCKTCGLYGGKMGCPGHFGHVRLAMPVFFVLTLNWCKNLLGCICYYCSRLTIDQKSLKLKCHGKWDSLNEEDRWDKVIHYKKPLVCPFQCTGIHQIPQPQFTVEKLRVLINWENVIDWIKKQELNNVCPCDQCTNHKQIGSCQCSFCLKHQETLAPDEDPCACDTCTEHRQLQKCQCNNCIHHHNTLLGILKSTKDLTEKEFTAADAGVILGGLNQKDLDFLGIHVDPITEAGHPKHTIMTVLPVEPRPLRPPSAQDRGRSRSQNDKTHKYQEIVKANLVIQESLLKASNGTIDRITPENIFSLPNVMRQHLNSADIQTYEWHIATLFHNEIKNVKVDRQRSGKPFKSLHLQFKGKPGWWRQHAVAKRTDQSARSVVSPCSALDINELGVPINEVCLVNTKRVLVTQYNIGELTNSVRLGPGNLGGSSHVFTINGDEIDLKHCEHRDRIELHIGMAVDRYLKRGDIVLFNRQPTLHRPSIMAFYVVPMQGNTFRLNLSVTAPFNADFDGDEMNMHVPQSPEEDAEALVLMNVQNLLCSGQSSKPVMALVQDSVAAAWKMTRRDRFFTKDEACQLLMQCKHYVRVKLPGPAIVYPKKLWTGKQIFSCLFPKTMMYERWRPDSNRTGAAMDIMDDHIVVRHGSLLCGRLCKAFVGSSGNGFVHFIWHMPDAGPRFVVKFLSDSQRMFNYLLLAYENFSIGPADLILEKDTHKKIQEIIETAIRKDETIRNEPIIMNGLRPDIVEAGRQQILKRLLPRTAEIAASSLPDGNGCKDVTSCGSKGSSINIGQMTACVGQQTVEGGRLTKGLLPCFSPDDESPARFGLVRSSLIQGLKPYEFFCHAQAGREGLVDTAVKTAETGYIQRRATRASENIAVECDGTVRRWDGNTLQIKYGGDGWAPERLVRCHLSYLNHKDSEVCTLLNITDDEYLKICKIPKARQSTELLKLKESLEEELAQILILKNLVGERRKIVYHKLATVSIEDVYTPSNVHRDALYVQGYITGKSSVSTSLTPSKIRLHIIQLMRTIHDCDGPDNKTRDYYLLIQFTIRKILIDYRMTEEQLVELCKLTIYRYKTGKCQPGEAVGHLAAESLGEPTTQMTLNTFHLTGIGTKLVTSGVPRVKELIALHKVLKMTTMTIAFHPRVQQKPDLIYRLAHIIVETKLEDIIESVDVIYDPDLLVTRIPEHQPLVDLYSAFVETFEDNSTIDDMDTVQQIAANPQENINVSTVGEIDIMDFEDTHDCEMYDIYLKQQNYVAPPNQDIPEEFNVQSRNHPVIQKTSRFVVSLALDQEVLIDRGLGPKDVARVVRQRLNMNQSKLAWLVMASEFNMAEWVLRLRIPLAYEQTVKWCTSSKLDINSNEALAFERDLCYQSAQGFLHSIHVGGIRGITGTSIRKDKSQELVIDTVGSNLLDIFMLDGVDQRRTTTNNLYEIESVLGIDAASDALFYEYKIPMDLAGASINDRHLSLIADLQCADGCMKALTRHGINQDHAPLTQISFEESVDNMLRAALFKKKDQVMDVTSNVMLGQCIPLGTGRVGIQVHEDYGKLMALSANQHIPIMNAAESSSSIVLSSIQSASISSIDDEILRNIEQYQWPSYSHPITDKRRIAHISGVLRRTYCGTRNTRILNGSHNPCPLPVSVSSQDLKRNGENIENYTAREKTDGERYQLILDNDPIVGRYACMVNRNMSIWDIAICASSDAFDKISMYDVEISQNQKTNMMQGLVMDVIQHAGQSFVDETWKSRYQRVFDIFDDTLQTPQNQSAEEYDEHIMDIVKQSTLCNKLSKVIARWTYPNLTGFMLIPKSLSRLSELNTILRKTDNLTRTDYRCDGLVIQQLNGTIITGRDPGIMKWKDRNMITIDVKISEDYKPLALVGDGTTSHVPCSDHVRLSQNLIEFKWAPNLGQLMTNSVVECSVILDGNICELHPVRIREKPVANTVYVISKTLENVIEALTIQDVLSLLGIAEPVLEAPPVENYGSIPRVSPSRVLDFPVHDSAYRPGSPTIVANETTESESSEFFRPGSPVIYRHKNDVEQLEPEPMDLDIVLPQEVLEHHAMVNDPLFTMLE